MLLHFSRQNIFNKKCYSSMTAVNYVVFLVAMTFLLTCARGDEEVICAFMGSCVLPCNFQAGADIVVHWIQIGNVPVHSYYHNEDQFSHQNPHFRGRTSLFKNEVSKGNASLQLTRVNVKDGGRYKCYTSTISGNKESFIIISVDAPVRKVTIQQESNTITCRSDGLYPKPEITWSTFPKSVGIDHKVETKLDQTEQQLFNIASYLTLSDDVSDFRCVCTVTTQRSRGIYTLSIKTEKSEDTKFTCIAPSTHWTDLIWIFNHNETILTQNGFDNQYTVSDEWRSRVKNVSKSGDLTLKDVSSKDDGTYTCKLSNSEEICIKNTILTITENTAGAIAGAVIGIIIAVGVVCLVIFLKCTKGSVI